MYTTPVVENPHLPQGLASGKIDFSTQLLNEELIFLDHDQEVEPPPTGIAHHRAISKRKAEKAKKSIVQSSQVMMERMGIAFTGISRVDECARYISCAIYLV